MTTRKQVRVNSDVLEKFERMYSHCFARFIRNCMEKAISSPEWFQSVFFSDEDLTSFEQIQTILNIKGGKENVYERKK